MAFTCRSATPADFETLNRLVIEAFEPITYYKRLDERFGPLNGVPWRERWRDRLAKIFAEQECLVGEDDGVIVAFACGAYDKKPATAFVDVLAVAPGRQRRGYGRAMLREAMAYFERRGAKYLRLDCLVGNDRANELYRAAGFEEIDREIHWFIQLDRGDSVK